MTKMDQVRIYGERNRSLGFTMCFSNATIPDLSKVKLTTSKIHGKGVFATELIRRGEVVTIYPSHGAGYVSSPGVCDLRFKNDEHLKMAQKMGTDTKKYEFVLGKLHMLGIPDVHYPCYLGHLLNDGSDISSRDQYLKTCLVRNNTIFNCYRKVCYVQAVRDIPPGEELTVAYGDTYWKDQDETKLCHTCRNWGTQMKKCSRCQKTLYCCRACQKADWGTHKHTCKK